MTLIAREPDGLIDSWITIRKDWRAVMVKWPWVWGRIGFCLVLGRPWCFTVSQWRDEHLTP